MTAGSVLLLLELMRMMMMTVDVVTRVLLFPLRTPVLEPDLDLSFCETECKGQTETLADGQVAGQSELVLECRQLVVTERCSSATTTRPALAVLRAHRGGVVTAGVCSDHLVIVTLKITVTTAAICCLGTHTADNTTIALDLSVCFSSSFQPFICKSTLSKFIYLFELRNYVPHHFISLILFILLLVHLILRISFHHCLAIYHSISVSL